VSTVTRYTIILVVMFALWLMPPSLSASIVYVLACGGAGYAIGRRRGRLIARRALRAEYQALSQQSQETRPEPTFQ
jgi:hypothetical protein